LTLTPVSPADLDVDALVVAAYRTDAGPRLAQPDLLPPALVRHLDAVLPALGFAGARAELARVPSAGTVKAPLVAVLGLGQVDDDVPTLSGSRPPTQAQGGIGQGGPAQSVQRANRGGEALRRAAGTATSALTGVESVGLLLPADSPQAVAAVAEGAALGAYAFARYLADGPTPPGRIAVITPLAKDKAAEAAGSRAATVAAAVLAVRDLVNTAPNDQTPQGLAAAVRAPARKAGVKVSVLDESALETGGFGGLLAVGKGSANPPRLVKLTWSGPKARTHVALVGKGITFDSGGLSLKTAGSMTTMKSDMSGAAAVAATVIAVAQLGLPVRVTGWLALAENMPSGSAQRPGDVIVLHGGKTVEVLNTDAEGRLVLADALDAAAGEGPDAIVDIATLTGAQVVALGPRIAAAMGTEDVCAGVVAAAEAAGEMVWPMPLPADLLADLDSKVADLANIGGRNGAMLTAGLFLREFTGGRPWAHLDIAGPAYNTGAAHDYTPHGATGFGVRTLVEFVEALSRRTR
jgi:leucyl aminopeptidase